MKIAVVGTGYVGLSNAVVLAQHHEVKAVDIDAEKVDLINRRLSPIIDADLQDYLSSVTLNLEATTDATSAYVNASFVVVSTPTDYDPETNYFNTDSVDSVVAEVVRVNPDATVVIKSTVPLASPRHCRSATTRRRSFSRRSFCVRVGRYMTICIPRGSSSETEASGGGSSLNS